MRNRFAGGREPFCCWGLRTAARALWCATLISQFVPKGRVGLIDADIGQSTVGPPACISYADCPADFSGDPGRLRPAALSFARSLSPGADPLGFFLACERIVRFARERRPQFLLVDTTGFIDGVLAVELKLTKVEWLRPAWIVALQRAGELEPVLARLPKREQGKVVRISVVDEVRRRSREQRRAYRERKWAEYFRRAAKIRVPLAQFSFRNFWFNSGNALSEEEKAAFERLLDCQIVYGERQREGIFLIGDGLCRRDELFLHGLAGEAVHLTASRSVQERILAFVNARGLTIGLGVLLGIVPQKRELVVLTPLRRLQGVSWIELGEVQHNPFPEAPAARGFLWPE